MYILKKLYDYLRREYQWTQSSFHLQNDMDVEEAGHDAEGIESGSSSRQSLIGIHLTTILVEISLWFIWIILNL